MKTLYIVRGAPGSGKSTLAATLAPNAHISADDFMVDSGGAYKFDPRRLGDCHARCLAGVERLMASHDSVAVANTFVRREHIRPYENLAARMGFSIFQIECQNDFGNIHGVPAHTVRRMRTQMER